LRAEPVRPLRSGKRISSSRVARIRSCTPRGSGRRGGRSRSSRLFTTSPPFGYAVGHGRARSWPGCSPRPLPAVRPRRPCSVRRAGTAPRPLVRLGSRRTSTSTARNRRSSSIRPATASAWSATDSTTSSRRTARPNRVALRYSLLARLAATVYSQGSALSRTRVTSARLRHAVRKVADARSSAPVREPVSR